MDEVAAGLRFKLEELERRLNGQAEDIKTVRVRTHEIANEVQRRSDHERRITELESQNVDVLSTKFGYLESRVDSMSKALWAAAGSLLVAAAVFALSVASGQIG